MNGFKQIALPLIVALLCSCKNGGNDATPASTSSTGGSTSSVACDSITGGASTITTAVDSGCANCSISNAPAAADNDRTTFATLSVNGAAPNQGASIRATGQTGIVFPSGQTAGAFVRVPSGNGQSYTVTMRTLLNGVIQESDSSWNNGGVCGACGNGASGGNGQFGGFVTTKQFDAVEVFINNNQASGTPAFDVYEICSNHR